MIKDEALNLALEALEEAHPKPYNESVIAHVEAITAIKQALVAPVQEPVAIVSGYYGGQCVVLPIDPARIFNSGTAFYISPPAQEFVCSTGLCHYKPKQEQNEKYPPEQWRERWYGSGSEKGWWIVCGRNRIAHLGVQVSSDEVSKVVDAHNRYKPTVQPKQEQDEPAPVQEPVNLHQVLTDPENQPNQYGVNFGMYGEKMMFKIGGQQFALDYEPDTENEFNFMRDMLIRAFSTFTHGVKTTPPHRTWVKLTDEEIEQGCKESWITEQAFQSAVWWAEAKLKDKNT